MPERLWRAFRHGFQERATDGTRTRDVLDHNQVLYQLSYGRHVDSGAYAELASTAIPGRPGSAIEVPTFPELEGHMPIGVQVHFLFRLLKMESPQDDDRIRVENC